jgi:hypothetical protein
MRIDPNLFRINYDRTPAQLRRSGLFLVPLGLLIAAAGAAMLPLAFGWIPPAEWLPAGTRIEPRTEPWETPIGLVVFLSGIVLFGVITIAEGAWRILYSHMNLTLLRIMLVLVGIFFFVGSIASMMLGRRYGQVGQ